MKRWLIRLTVLLLLWLCGVSAWIWIGPEEDASASADYALVLGAAVYDDVPSPVFQARIDHAIDLYRQGRVRAIVFTGGKSDGDSLSEAEAASTYARSKGVPADHVFLENQSRTTMENLVFAQPSQLGIDDGSFLIVSDPLHLRRAMQMADDLGYSAQASSASNTRYLSLDSKLPFAMRELYFIHHYWLFGA